MKIKEKWGINIMFFINGLLLIAGFSLGFILGKNTFHKKHWYYDAILIFLVIISTWIGINTFIVNLGDISLRLNQGLQMVFLGIFAKRLLHLHLKR
jgi:hypothetical protein